MISNLSNGYLVAVDKEFVRYIQNQKYNYDDDENIDMDKLMILVLNKYKIRAPITSGQPSIRRTGEYEKYQ